MSHHNYRNIAILEEKMRSHQNISYALIGGLVTCLFCAVFWAVTTVISGYQFALIAIVIGVVVGFGVRYFGAGYDPIFGVIGGVYALLACVLGNLFSQIGFSMSEEGLTLMQVVSLLNVGNIIDTMVDSFDLFDLVFYGIAVFEGIKFSRRGIEPGADPALSMEPTLSSLRAPLVGTMAVSLIGLLIYMAVKSPEITTFTYPTGEKMSEGTFIGGLEDGTWEYYHINGQLQIRGDYASGLEVGDWKHYHDNGQLEMEYSYVDGLQDGPYRSYYADGQLFVETTYENGRQEGTSKVYHANGRIANEGSYVMDRQVGMWSYYSDSGILQSEGIYNDGVETGTWKYYWPSGDPQEVLIFDSEGQSKVVDAWDADGIQLVSAGAGSYSHFDPETNTRSIGEVADGSPAGIWKQYLDDRLVEEGEYSNDIYKILNVYSKEGQPVKDGQGIYNSYYPISGDLSEKGRVVDGLRDGLWTLFYDSLNIPMVETEYVQGKMTGKVTVYDEMGDKTYDMEYENDVPHGLCIWYHGEGMKASEVTFVNGNKQGVQKFWNGSGVLTKEETYDAGEMVSEE